MKIIFRTCHHQLMDFSKDLITTLFTHLGFPPLHKLIDIIVVYFCTSTPMNRLYAKPSWCPNDLSHNCIFFMHIYLPQVKHSLQKRDHSVHAPGQWEMTLHCSVVSHWLGAYTKWSLQYFRGNQITANAQLSIDFRALGTWWTGLPKYSMTHEWY